LFSDLQYEFGVLLLSSLGPKVLTKEEEYSVVYSQQA